MLVVLTTCIDDGSFFMPPLLFHIVNAQFTYISQFLLSFLLKFFLLHHIVRLGGFCYPRVADISVWKNSRLVGPSIPSLSPNGLNLEPDSQYPSYTQPTPTSSSTHHPNNPRYNNDSRIPNPTSPTASDLEYAFFIPTQIFSL